MCLQSICVALGFNPKIVKYNAHFVVQCVSETYKWPLQCPIMLVPFVAMFFYEPKGSYFQGILKQ